RHALLLHGKPPLHRTKTTFKRTETRFQAVKPLLQIAHVRGQRHQSCPQQLEGDGFLAHPTLPSRLTARSFCASTAKSIGSSLTTSRQNPLTIKDSASSSERPRWRQ